MGMINDGGPAFPVWELNGKEQPEMTGFGMSLRDYFAAKAMGPAPGPWEAAGLRRMIDAAIAVAALAKENNND